MNEHINDDDRIILDIIKSAIWDAARTEDFDELPNWRKSSKYIDSSEQLGRALTKLIKQYRGQ